MPDNSSLLGRAMEILRQVDGFRWTTLVSFEGHGYLQVPIHLGVNGPDGADGNWTSASLSPSNWFTLSETDCINNDLHEEDVVVFYIQTEVERMRTDPEPDDFFNNMPSTGIDDY